MKINIADNNNVDVLKCIESKADIQNDNQGYIELSGGNKIYKIIKKIVAKNVFIEYSLLNISALKKETTFFSFLFCDTFTEKESAINNYQKLYVNYMKALNKSDLSVYTCPGFLLNNIGQNAYWTKNELDETNSKIKEVETNYDFNDNKNYQRKEIKNESKDKDDLSQLSYMFIESNSAINLDTLNNSCVYSECNIEELEERNELVLYLSNKAFKWNTEGNQTFLLSLPLLAKQTIKNKTKYLYQGACFVYCQVPNDYELKKEAVDNLVNELIDFFKQINWDVNASIGDGLSTMLKKSHLKAALITILIDSYAHNISAHSLSALKWWIELRHRMLDQRFKITNGIELSGLGPSCLKLSEADHGAISEKYYTVLGKQDGIYNKDYYSLLDLLQFADKNLAESLFKWDSKVTDSQGFEFNPRFPVPIDYALLPFLKFLRDKGAFWSGVTRDLACGGESKTCYQVLWEDFFNNPLYLGTIARTEGVTRINLHLQVKYEDKEKQGHFASIDMSVIDYEENIIKNNAESSEKEVEDKSKEINSGSAESDYSIYWFARPGPDFLTFRELLSDKKKFSLFLPGGIVGEHAFFTIIENTIRNVKHYTEKEQIKEIQENGLNLWISIEEEGLKNSNSNSSRAKELFKIGVWLQHETNMVDLSSRKNLDKSLSERTRLAILDPKSGAPRMGGNYQDKACAAMLFKNHFALVDETESDYYPWLQFKNEPNKDEYTKGILKKFFYLWRGEDVFFLTTDENLKNENVARFKFVVLDNQCPEKSAELKKKARQAGVIRFLEKSVEDENNKPPGINKFYSNWNSKWLIPRLCPSEKAVVLLKKSSSEGISSILGGFEFDENSSHFIAKRDAKYQDSKLKKVDDDRNSQGCPVMTVLHGSSMADNRNYCNIRSHGWFMSQLFSECHGNEDTIATYPPKSLDNPSDVKFMALIPEMLETLLTRTVIFDDRVYDRFPPSMRMTGENNDSFYAKELNLRIYPEDKDVFKLFIESPIEDNFLVVHLSFIEKLGYGENSLNTFIKDKIKVENNDKFILVITTGRGRDDWMHSLSPENAGFTVFRPIESILNAVESGLSYRDDFEVKHNLMKVLFGS